jgi:hypothetical protein
MTRGSQVTPVKNLLLPRVTLICVTGVNIENSAFALWRSSLDIEFGAVKLVSNRKPEYLPKGIDFEQSFDSRLDSIDSYSKYMIYDLWKHVETEFCLIVQADGYVIHPEMWSDEFLDYDYIGAPWRFTHDAYIDPFGNHQRVGNGGFSLRSSKLLSVPNRVEIPWDVNADDFYRHMGAGLFSEDGNICVHNRHLYEGDGCIWAPLDVAINFSKEQTVSEWSRRPTFGFHKKMPSLPDLLKDYWLRKKFRRLY